MPDDPDSHNHHPNGPSNNDIEQRTWDWFASTVGQRFGSAYYQVTGPSNGELWPDVIAVRAHNRVGFEIPSPLRPEDVVKKTSRIGAAPDDAELPPHTRLEQRVIEALRRKIKKYGDRQTGMPLALLITLAHPSAQKLSGQMDLRRLAGTVRGHISNFLHQPLDAVYLVGPGEHAYLLWRRRGPQWKKIFPDLPWPTPDGNHRPPNPAESEPPKLG
jgi:hypothetical protein